MEIERIGFEEAHRKYGNSYHYVIRNGGDSGFRQEWYEENTYLDEPDNIRLKPENGILVDDFLRATRYEYHNSALEIRDELMRLLGGMWTVDKVWDSGVVISIFDDLPTKGCYFMYEVK